MTSTLWFEGSNQTVDAVVVDEIRRKILLITRGDTGELALAGGFLDSNDSSAEAGARRETAEETGLVLATMGRLIYHGVVDDPRNSDRSWIETSAFLFSADSSQAVNGSDDALRADWHDIDDHPSLYASHDAIVRRAIDALHGFDYMTYLNDEYTITTPVSGGHMQYEKYYADTQAGKLFVKAHAPESYTDIKKAERSLTYLEKEAAAMAHLRTERFAAVPTHSALDNNRLVMEAFHPDDGWYWRAPHEELEAYIDAAIHTFEALEATQPALDTFDIEATIESMRREGWHGFTDETFTVLDDKFNEFTPRLTAETQISADRLRSELRQLHNQAIQPRSVDQLVPSHHDARQSNIAWHPDQGMRLVDWSWAGYGEPGSDITNLLIDLHKSGHDISRYAEYINERHCLTLIGFLLGHVTWPLHGNDDSVRFQQFVSAVSAYEVLNGQFKRLPGVQAAANEDIS